MLVGGLALTPAQAADLGGDCCADLEERVAELEATTARKGNRKVSLTIYGQVNQGVLWWDRGRTENGREQSNVYVVDNDHSSTRFGFKGKAKIHHDLEAGFKIEIEWQGQASNGITEASDESDQHNLRHASWYLKHKQLGTITVGQTDTALSGTAEVNLGGDSVIGLNANPLVVNDITFGGSTLRMDRVIFGNLESNRRNVVRYDSPTLAGFRVSAAWGEDDIWDVALRYAGVLGDFRVAGAVGYEENVDSSNWGAPATGYKAQTVNGSMSVLHVPTGLFVTGAAGQRETDFDRANDTNTKREFWYIKAGIYQKFFSIGKTSLFGAYGSWDSDEDAARDLMQARTGIRQNAEADMWQIGIVQHVDAAAMELYASYWNFETNVPQTDDIQAFLAGARIKF
jgi:predicted porin